MYYVYLNNNAFGPYTVDQVRGMVALGEVQPTTPVYEQDGKQQWEPLQKYHSLMQAPPKDVKKFAFNPSASSVPINPGTIERTLWVGRPSAWSDWPRYFKNLLIIALTIAGYILGRRYFYEEYPQVVKIGGYVGLAVCILALLRILWFWFNLKSKEWTLTTERLTFQKGLFSTRKDNLELYRVKDLAVKKPLFLRIVGYGYITLITSDKTDQDMIIGAVKKPDDVYQMLRKAVERQRERRGVREFDAGSVS